MEAQRWCLRAARLEGQVAYRYLAEGRGEMEGVNVLWGRSDEAPEHGRHRRFKVMIGSEVLWRHRAAGRAAYDCARDVLEQIGRDLWTVPPAPKYVAVRRVDVCVDHWGYTWSIDDVKRFACRQISRGTEEAGEKPITDTRTIYGPTSATYYIGAQNAAARYLRVYDKIAEAMARGKLPWMEPAWRAHGWDGETKVWRAEVQFGGDWLHAHGFDTMDKLIGCEHALWTDYIEDVRHTSGGNARLDRRATSRVWRCLRGSVARERRRGAPATWIWCPRPPSAGGDMKRMTAMVGGCGRKIREAMFGSGSDEDEDRCLSFMHDAIDQAAVRAAVKAVAAVRRGLPAAAASKLDDALRDALAASEARAQQRAAQLAALGRRSRPPPKPPPDP